MADDPRTDPRSDRFFIPAFLWKAPDGSHYEVERWQADPEAAYLLPITQDPDTRQWDRSDGPGVTVSGEVLRADWTPFEREPLRDPYLTRLATLVNALLHDYEQHTGRPAADADDIRAALAEVEALPQQARNLRYAAAHRAARARAEQARRHRRRR
ncbi:hypothetical protein GCM10027168_00840 [Streptomyces capparidis]